MNPNTSKARGAATGGGIGGAISTIFLIVIPWHKLPCFYALVEVNGKMVCPADEQDWAVTALQGALLILVTAAMGYVGAWQASPNEEPAKPTPNPPATE